MTFLSHQKIDGKPLDWLNFECDITLYFHYRSVFAPSCISHSILSRKDWHHIRMDDISLPDALRCWERQTKSKTLENAMET